MSGDPGDSGSRKISGRLTTESEPNVSGCSGSAMGAMRSYISCASMGSGAESSSEMEEVEEEGVAVAKGSGR